MNLKKLIPFLPALLLVGCSSDHSADTREVSTPNAPVTSPKPEDFSNNPAPIPDQVSNNPDIPPEARDKLSKVIPRGQSSR